MKTKRQRAKHGKTYYYIDADLRVLTSEDTRSVWSNKCYKLHNYFLIKKEAKIIAREFKQKLKGETCEWYLEEYDREDYISYYRTECNFEHTFGSRKGVDEDFKFCPYCGKLIKIVKRLKKGSEMKTKKVSISFKELCELLQQDELPSEHITATGVNVTISGNTITFELKEIDP